MSGDIGPGDFIECVNASAPPGMTSRLTEGAIYRAAEVGIVPADYTHVGRPYVRVEGVTPTPGTFGFCIRRFRPVYRPSADLIENLKAPAPASREPVLTPA